MILLKFGIRCLTHFCVPLTLGLLAWNASWHGVSQQKLTKSSTQSANPADLAASPNSERSATESSAGNDATKAGRSNPESIAMHPAGSESAERGLAIPRADARNHNQTAKTDADAETSNGPGYSDDRDRGAPRDRNIDATGLETSIADSAAAPPASTAKVHSELAGNACASTSPETAAAQADQNPPEKSAALPVAASANTAGDSHEERSQEPADLKPEVRAIAAEVPRAETPTRPKEELVQSASPAQPSDAGKVRKAGDSEPAANAERTGAQAVDPPTADSTKTITAANDVSRPVSSTREATNEPKAAVGRPPEKLPDIVVAQEGDTWSRIAARVYGEEKMAEAIWKENLDAHGATSESLPIAGRLVRLPSPRSGAANDGTQLARTAP